MSNVQISASREMHDMSHFVYTCGDIGRLKVLSFENLNAGDSLEMNTVGSFRLSPLKRGLVLDACVELFTFYIPYRHTYDLGASPDGFTGEWVDFMRNGVNSGSLSTSGYDGANSEFNVRFLGTRQPGMATKQVPKWLWEGYRQIWNNYFKRPDGGDMVGTIDALTDTQRKSGMECNHLKTMWSAPLDSTFQGSVSMGTAEGSIDIIALNQAYGQLHTNQERSLFMKRYRDVIESFGGKTTIDADSRPQLLMRSKFWASGYDVDGTDQTSLGQFSGRVQQTFSHKIPRWYCPEHGAVITLALVRFPPVVNGEVSYFIAHPDHTYQDLVGDPSVTGNHPAVVESLANVIPGAPANNMNIPHGQWHRYHHSHVDEQYDDIGDMPFIDPVDFPTDPTGNGYTYVQSQNYDDCFQSMQLQHWNMQMKFNDKVIRRLPTARDALMTN